MNPPTHDRAPKLTASCPPSVSLLIEQQAHRLLCAHAAVAKANASEDFEQLAEAAFDLMMASSQIYGDLAVALREQTATTAAETPPPSQPNRPPRKGLSLVR